MMLRFVSAILVLGLVAGCEVVPARPVVVRPAVAVVPPPGVIVPRGVVYVAPVHPIPAPGYFWRYHPRYGWGWYHPRLGWYDGWR